AVGEKVKDFERSSRAAQYVNHGLVDDMITVPSALVRWPGSITQIGDNEAMLYTADIGLIAGEPRYRTDRCRNKEETITETGLSHGELATEQGQQRQTGAIVVRQRRMADVR